MPRPRPRSAPMLVTSVFASDRLGSVSIPSAAWRLRSSGSICGSRSSALAIAAMRSRSRHRLYVAGCVGHGAACIQTRVADLRLVLAAEALKCEASELLGETDQGTPGCGRLVRAWHKLDLSNSARRSRVWSRRPGVISSRKASTKRVGRMAQRPPIGSGEMGIV